VAASKKFPQKVMCKNTLFLLHGVMTYARVAIIDNALKDLYVVEKCSEHLGFNL
jgi:hypothetical protein